MRFCATIPADAGKVVGIATFNGKLIIACEFRVYVYDEEYGELTQISAVY